MGSESVGSLGHHFSVARVDDIPLSALLAAQNPAVGGAPLTAAQNWELLSAGCVPAVPAVADGLLSREAPPP